ncbi:MAG: class I SAM-dependent methyltransferase [Treponemataceae bacterium]
MSEKLFKQVEYFENRLNKNKRHLLKWARRNQVFCFRVYDKDIPEIPLCVDLYYEQGKQVYESPYVVFALYKRPYEKSETEERAWLATMKEVIVRVFETSDKNFFFKLRQKRKENAKEQSFDNVQKEKRIIVSEGNARFYINLNCFLDTGLFLDHRFLRRHIFNIAKGKRVLNLFCYTASFSVFAKLGEAEKVVSVDLSKNYLNWARDNFKLNGLDFDNADFIAADVFTFLKAHLKKSRKFKNLNTKQNKLYDIIICDAPTFSNSKKTKTVLDINRDWTQLCELCLELLDDEGVFYFSCNSKKIKINFEILDNFKQNFFEKNFQEIFIKDMSLTSLDEDFKNKKPHILLEFQKVQNKNLK